MSYIHPALAEHLRKLATRPDAYRWARPGTPEARMPGWLDPWATRVRMKEAAEDEARARAAAEQEEFEREVLELREANGHLRIMLADVKFELALRALGRKYSPNQPRVPAGSREGGQWTREGGDRAQGSSGDDHARASGRNDPRILSDATPDNFFKPGTQLAGDPPETLRRLHPDSTYETDPKAKRSLDYWRRQPTGTIVESLKPGAENSLKVKPDGTIMDGNTRTKVLEERGYDIESLRREPRPPAGGRGPRGGGGLLGGGGGGGFGGGGGAPRLLPPWF